jgi:hypothetical protein
LKWKNKKLIQLLVNVTGAVNSHTDAGTTVKIKAVRGKYENNIKISIPTSTPAPR